MATKVQFGEVRSHNYTVGTATTGGNLVAFDSSGNVKPAGATDIVVGWTPYDGAVADRVPVYRGLRVPVIVSGTVAPGNQAVPAANGTAAAIAAPGGTYAAADTTASRQICGVFETGGLTGTEQVLILN